MSLLERDTVMVSTDEEGNAVVDLPHTRANNVEGLGRSFNTYYSVGNVVYVDSNLSVALKCITAGTTSNAELNISTKNIGDTVTDGSVVWQVCNRTSDVTSVNGKTGDVVVDTLPIGAIIPHSGNTVPTGYLTCNGAAVSRTTYADLFAVIGTTYGAGNGSTTFNLPNLGSNIVSDVASGDVPVVGNDKGLGVLSQNGTERTLVWSSQNNSSHWVVPVTIGQDFAYNDGSQTVLITKNPANSGIVAKMSATKTTVKYIIKAFSSVTNQGNVDLQDIASDYERVNTELAKVAGISDYIVESYRNETEWYRIWKSGRVEQGGKIAGGTDQHMEFTLLKQYADTNYDIWFSRLATNYGNTAVRWEYSDIEPASTTKFKCDRINYDRYWRADGQGV